jgi:hypothetical protein
MKTSYSQNNTYISCARHWDILYNEKLKSPIEGASTYFGSAMDAAVTELLNGKSINDAKIVFYDRWNKAYAFGKSTPIFDNPDIIFAHKDFDIDVLEDKDLVTAAAWAGQLSLLAVGTPLTKNEVDSMHSTLSRKKKNPFVPITKDELIMFNRLSWLSMKRKGKILLNAFNTQFMPKVKKVLATQKQATINDPTTGDTIVGFVDMILELEGYSKPIIFDLKTAGQPYKQEDIDLTQQLTLYAAMKGNEFNTDLVGYVILSKNIPKKHTSTCKSCGNVKTGRHATCEVKVGGVRCGGEWLEVSIPDPQVQVMVEKKSPQQINDLLLDYGNILLAMKNGIVYKNVSKCNNWYGQPCPYYKYCHGNDKSGLVKK